ncbi:MAG TPA: HlyD family efflux transporter periplasmic adaptor subunit [Steroidobacteraceae bacterium]|nr:HlyD family efflux transporter periplasmic adaptor subunit [Steroidobacteraceae bacterium]
MNSPDADDAPTSQRRTRLLVLAAVVLAVGIAYGAYWLVHGRYYESTEDAYVASDLVQITSEVPGAVVAVHVDDTQQVERGQLLVELDRSDAEVAMAQAEAELARAVREVRGLFAQASGLRAQLRERDILLAAARADLARRQQIAHDGALSGEDFQHAKDQVAQLEAALNVTREALQTTNTQIDGTVIETHPQVLSAAAHVRDAELALKRTRIVAPVSGAVARRSVQIGARIAAGAPLMAVVPLANAWVDANFKEVQLARVRIGQPVTLESDFYGDDIEYHGRVVGVGAGSGSAFALLPAQNASGNWIKIVQRVPVRIALEPNELASHPLRVGLSMHAQIDLHDTPGSLAAQQIRAQPQQLVANDAHDEAATQRIARIIAANAGTQLTSRLSP